MFSCVTASPSSCTPPNTQVSVSDGAYETLYSLSTVVAIPSYFLDTPITDQDIATIARVYLVRWEELSPHLELTVRQENEIRRTFREYEDQKREALRTWKRNKGNGATYDSFITAAEAISNMQLADNVRGLLKERLPPGE